MGGGLPADGLRTKLLVQCHGEAKEAAVLSPLDHGLGDIQVEGGIPPEAKAEEVQEAKVQRPRHPCEASQQQLQGEPGESHRDSKELRNPPSPSEALLPAVRLSHGPWLALCAARRPANLGV
ncbi:hypothetical protein E2320_016275 [Naja naja]|nr:hypothetical protein E2320_016275 [Naja naja]